MPLDRQQLESMLSAYLDGELTEQERAEVETFLAADADARRLLDELRATVAGLTALPRAKASDEFADTLRSHLERRALLGAEAPARMPRVSAPSSVGRRFAAAAIIALATLTGYFTWSFTRESDRHAERFAMKEATRSPSEQLAREAQPATSLADGAPDRMGQQFRAARDTTARRVTTATPSDEPARSYSAKSRLTKGTSEESSIAAVPEPALRPGRDAGPVEAGRRQEAPAVAMQPSSAEFLGYQERLAEGDRDGRPSSAAGKAEAPPAGPTRAWSLATSAPQEGRAIAEGIPLTNPAEGHPDAFLGGAFSLRSASAPHVTMPVLGPDMSSQPAAPQARVGAIDARTGQEAFIVMGAPVPLITSEHAGAAVATRPAPATGPVLATRPAPTTAPATGPASHTAP